MRNCIFLFFILLGTLNIYSQNTIEVVISQSDALSINGQYESARLLLVETLSKTNSDKSCFLLLSKLCSISKDNSKIQYTLEYGHHTISKKFSGFKNLEPYGDALYNLSVAKFRLGEIDSTFYYAEEALANRKKHLPAIHEKIVQNLSALGTFHSNKGNTKVSIEYQEKALSTALQLTPPNYNSLTASYFSLGSAYHSSNNIVKARENYDKALSYYRNNLATNEKYKGHIFNAIGVLLETQKDYEASQEYYNEAIKLFTKANNVFVTTTAYSNLANNYTNLGKYNEAKKIHKKVISILEDSEYENELPWKYLNLGATYLETLEYDSALVVLNKAKLVNTKVSGAENELSTVILNHCAAVYINLNQHEKAKRELLKSIKIAKEIFGLKDHDLAESYYLLAKNYFNQNDTENGFKYLKLAEETLFSITHLTIDFKSEIISRTLLLEIYNLKEKALWAQYITTKNISFLNSLYQATISTLKLSNIILDFYDHENAKLDIFGYIDENLLYGIRASKQLYDLTKDQQYTAQALKFFEAEKSILLKQEHNSFTAKQNNQIADSLLIREDQLKRNISQNQNLLFAENDQTTDYSKKLSSEVFNLKRDLDLLLKEIELNNPNYFAQKYQRYNVDLAQIKAETDSNEVIIEYYQNNNDVYSISISNAKTQFKYVLIDGLEDKIKKFNTSILNSDITIFSELAFEFYNHLLAEHLDFETKKQLTIIPSKSISFLSFDVFINEISNQISYNKFNYLVKEKSISYKNSLQKTYLNKVQAKNLYIGICPEFKTNNFNSLSGAAKEIEFIAKELNGEIITDAENLKQTTLEKISQYKIIHFATHALLNSKNSSYSCLLLGGDTLEAKNKLYAYEIQSTKLHSELVVLSACDTGNGELKSGEGVASLARSFNYAGAKSILLSLWALPDFSTSIIVKDFFKQLKYNNKSIALKNAKCNYLDSADEHLANPKFWAGLQLIGAKNKICLNKSRSNNNLVVLLSVVSVGLLIFFRKKLF